MRRRVVITGLGVVTSLGETVDGLWENVCAGKSGITPITRWDSSAYPVRFGGECAKFDVTQYGIDTREAKRLDRYGLECHRGRRPVHSARYGRHHDRRRIRSRVVLAGHGQLLRRPSAFDPQRRAGPRVAPL